MTSDRPWFFGKPYLWLVIGGKLILRPDRTTPALFPKRSARQSAESWAKVEHRFESQQWWVNARQIALYVEALRPPCSICGDPAPFSESVEIDPLCTDCFFGLHYSPTPGA